MTVLGTSKPRLTPLRSTRYKMTDNPHTERLGYMAAVPRLIVLRGVFYVPPNHILICADKDALAGVLSDSGVRKYRIEEVEYGDIASNLVHLQPYRFDPGAYAAFRECRPSSDLPPFPSSGELWANVVLHRDRTQFEVSFCE